MNKNIVQFVDPRRSQEEIREQACVWLARLDRGASQEEQAQLSAWVDSDPRNLRMLLNMAAMWDETQILSELSEIFPLEDKAQAVPSPRRRLVAAALAAFAVLGGGTFIGMEVHEVYVSNLVHETIVGERKLVELPDGSEVTLNTNTRVKVAFDGSERGLYLQSGEAFFSVSKDESRPFRVYVGSRVVEAVGTAFTVHHTGLNELEVLVTEGKVNYVERAGSEDPPVQEAAVNGRATPDDVRLSITSVTPVVAGEWLTVAQDKVQPEKVKLQPDELEVKLAWRVGMLVFQDDALESVLEEVSRYTTVKLRAEESIKGIQVEGLFRAGDIDGLLVAMQHHFQIDSQRISENEILLSPRKQE